MIHFARVKSCGTLTLMPFTRYVLSLTAVCVALFGACGRLAGRLNGASLLLLGAAVILLLWMAYRSGGGDD